MRLCVARKAAAPGWFPKLLEDTVLWGGDIADAPLRRLEPLDCRSAWLANPRCRSWSYASPGITGKPMPWRRLKAGGGERRLSQGSVSAVVRQRAGPGPNPRPSPAD